MDRITFQALTDNLMSLYSQGKYAEALDIVEQNADRFPEQMARTTFWKMCLLSLCGRMDDVILTFQGGLDSGLWWAESQFRDTDLDAVRDLPEFKSLVDISNKKSIEAQAQIGHDRTILVPDEIADELPLLIVLHGRNGNKDYNLENWEIARRRGWLVLSPQSRQSLYPGYYCWDGSEQGLEDILFHFEEILKLYKVDRKRIVIGGFSQGSGMAIYAALSGNLNVCGFIAVGTYIAEPDSLLSLINQATTSIRGYFVIGEKDYSLDKAINIQKILQENNIQFEKEVHSSLGHEFPNDFASSFDNAIKFILE